MAFLVQFFILIPIVIHVQVKLRKWFEQKIYQFDSDRQGIATVWSREGEHTLTEYILQRFQKVDRAVFKRDVQRLGRSTNLEREPCIVKKRLAIANNLECPSHRIFKLVMTVGL